MEEGYVRPEQFLFGIVTSVVLSMVMNTATQPRQTEGRQTMDGMPQNDVERLMSHYGITEEEAVELLSSYSVDLLLPQRGSGLAPVEIIGSSREDLASGLMVMEGSINTGEKAKITLCTEALPSDVDLATMYLDMVAMGCHVSYPTARLAGGVPTTEFVLQKGSPAWPLIIPLIVPLFTIGLVAFGITKLESITKALVPILLISLGGLIVLAAVVAKPATKVATAYIGRGGKVPYLPSTKGGSGKALRASKDGWDPFLGRDYKVGDKVIWVAQGMFVDELPPFLNNVYVIPASFGEMAKKYQLKKALAVR